MASKTITQFSDDLDGTTEGVQTVQFALFGAQYEVDLSKANQEKLAQALEPFLNKARKAGGSASTSRRSAGRSRSSGPDAKAVRGWAAENNIDVPPRGRIPGPVIKQYQDAH